ncbi:MAG: hypothetical protein KF752_04550 [Pirellulaceae bacterium]|nr:hypothetical protein [Pirellulaceae bacterium]
MHKPLWTAAMLVGLAVTGGTVTAQNEIVRIEEDWELTIHHPNAAIDAPQVTIAMMPFAQAPDLHLEVNLNYALKPDFRPGGVQVRVTHDDEILGHIHCLPLIQLTHESEVITWTAVLQKVEAGFAFGVQSGSSASWGNFGGNGYFLHIPAAFAPGGLTGYNYQHSLANSGATFGGNRVSSLRLKTLRIIDLNGQVLELGVDQPAQ